MGKKGMLLGLGLSLSMLWHHASATSILYVPQDNRPVSLAYTVATAEDAGYTMLTPPLSVISGMHYHGEVDGLWQWVEETAPQADVLVLSTDSLIYGGLVDSRKHHTPLSILESRVARIRKLKEVAKHRPIYAFGTIMRSPRASGGGVEPDYYSVYGPSIFRIAALQDKQDRTGLTNEDRAELFSLISNVPVDFLQDWFHRRYVNMVINKELIDLVRNHTFTYFALGHDDTSSLSQSALEARYLKNYSEHISSKEYGSFPGADQLGLLLIARARVDQYQESPTFETYYPLGGGEFTMPGYEDQSIGLTIKEHIEALGGIEVTGVKPEYLLAVNTPLTRYTGEAENFANLPLISPATNAFVSRIKEAIDAGITVGVADITYSNGSSNMLMQAMKQRGLLYKVGAYDGWNTASNAVGYALAQMVLSKGMTPHNHEKMLTQQYLDNWAYQANIRKEIYRMQEAIRTDNVRYTGNMTPEMESVLRERMQAFAEKELGVDPRRVTATFPWNRLFEIEAMVYDYPVVPLEKDKKKQEEIKEASHDEKKPLLDTKPSL